MELELLGPLGKPYLLVPFLRLSVQRSLWVAEDIPDDDQVECFEHARL